MTVVSSRTFQRTFVCLWAIIDVSTNKRFVGARLASSRRVAPRRRRICPNQGSGVYDSQVRTVQCSSLSHARLRNHCTPACAHGTASWSLQLVKIGRLRRTDLRLKNMYCKKEFIFIQGRVRLGSSGLGLLRFRMRRSIGLS